MLNSVDIPSPQLKTYIGKTQNGNVVNIQDLTSMTSYTKNQEFAIIVKTNNPYKCPVDNPPTPTIGPFKREDIFVKGNKSWEDVSEIVYSKEINKIVIDYFDKNIWVKAKTIFNDDHKWKVFGYYMTDNIQKHIGYEHWNNNNLVYWSRVALTLKL